MTQLSEWQKRVARDIAAAHPLTRTTPIRASGNSLVAQNDEPELSEEQLREIDAAYSQWKARDCRSFGQLSADRARGAGAEAVSHREQGPGLLCSRALYLLACASWIVVALLWKALA